MNIDLTPIFQAIITLLAALVTYKLIPWIKSKTNEQQQAALQSAVKIAVYAAEQLYGSGKGEYKKDYVINALRDAGYDISTDEIHNTIEKTVYELTLAVQQSKPSEVEVKFNQTVLSDEADKND